MLFVFQKHMVSLFLQVFSKINMQNDQALYVVFCCHLVVSLGINFTWTAHAAAAQPGNKKIFKFNSFLLIKKKKKKIFCIKLTFS